MLSSIKLKKLQPYIDIVETNKGRTIGEIYANVTGSKHNHYKKGASGLIVENMLGLKDRKSVV